MSTHTVYITSTQISPSLFQDSATACLSESSISSSDGKLYCSFVRSTVCTLQMPPLVKERMICIALPTNIVHYMLQTLSFQISGKWGF